MGINIYSNVVANTITSVNTGGNRVDADAVRAVTAGSAAQTLNISTLSAAFGCPPVVVETEEPVVTEEPEAQEDEQLIAAETPPPSSAADFLAPIRVIESPASHVSRTKMVINQSLFVAPGQDISVINSGTEVSIDNLTNAEVEQLRNQINEIRYPTDVDRFVTEGSYGGMDAFRYVLGSFWSVVQNEQGLVGQATMYCPFLDNGVMLRQNKMFKNIRLRIDPQNTTKFEFSMRPDYEFFDSSAILGEHGKYQNGILRDFVLGSIRQTSRYPDRYNLPLMDGQTFYDYTHAARMPLFSKEKENANIGRVLDADISYTVNYISEPYRQGEGGTTIYNPYRLYQVADNSTARDGIYYQGDEGVSDGVIAFTPKHIQKFSEIKKSYSGLYPVVVNINFATAQGGEFARILKTQTSTVGDLANRLLSFSETETFAEIMTETIEESREGQDLDEIRMENDMFVQESELGFEDIVSMLDSRITESSFNVGNFPLHEDEGEQSQDAVSSFLRRLETAIGIAKIKQIESSKGRTFLEVLQGKSAYAEPVAYIVEKYSVDGGGEISEGDPDQTYIFVDNDEVDRINFIDPQVNYEGEYVYRISVVNLVIGNEYTYEEINVGSAEVPPVTQASVSSYYHYAVDDSTFSSPSLEARTESTEITEGSGVKPAKKVSYILNSENYQGSATRAADLLRRGREPENEQNHAIWTIRVSDFTRPKETEVRMEIANRKKILADNRISFLSENIGQRLHATQMNVLGVLRSPEHDTIKVSGTCVPRARLIKVPYFEKIVFIDDHPPLSPDVDVVPFKGITDQVRITLNSRTGEEIAEPIFIEPDDEDLFTTYLNTQDMPLNSVDVRTGKSTQSMVKFKSDDAPVMYQIFRTTTPPLTYDDFRGNLHLQVANTLGAPAASQIDTIEPNIGYYYMFRSIDRGEHVSNPSKVFYVELISTDDGMYLDWRTYDFPREEKVHSLEFDDFFAIRAAEIQRIPDIIGQTPDGDDAFERPGDLTPGPNGDKIWGRTFVVRVKSTSTNRTFDIKFKCTNVYVDQTLDAQGVPSASPSGGSSPSGGGSY